jgi:hypothetical protein
MSGHLGTPRAIGWGRTNPVMLAALRKESYHPELDEAAVAGAYLTTTAHQ